MKHHSRGVVLLLPLIILASVAVMVLSFFIINNSQQTQKSLQTTKSPQPVTSPETQKTSDGSSISVVGRVVTIGNAPFTQWAIETSDGKMYGLTNVSEGEFRKFNQDSNVLRATKVEVKGILVGRTSPSFRTEESIEVIEIKTVQE